MSTDLGVIQYCVEILDPQRVHGSVHNDPMPVHRRCFFPIGDTCFRHASYRLHCNITNTRIVGIVSKETGAAWVGN